MSKRVKKPAPIISRPSPEPEALIETQPNGDKIFSFRIPQEQFMIMNAEREIVEAETALKQKMAILNGMAQMIMAQNGLTGSWDTLSSGRGLIQKAPVPNSTKDLPPSRMKMSLTPPNTEGKLPDNAETLIAVPEMKAVEEAKPSGQKGRLALMDKASKAYTEEKESQQSIDKAVN